jgi:hypothetical protein
MVFNHDESFCRLTFAITGGLGQRAEGALTKTVRVDGVVRRQLRESKRSLPRTGTIKQGAVDASIDTYSLSTHQLHLFIFLP